MLRPETLAEALSGVDRALLLSSPNQQMVETQSAFIDAAKNAGVRKIVKFSGLNASVASPFLFNRMHAEIEGHLERSGVTWTHLRPSQFMSEYCGNGPRSSPKVRSSFLWKTQSLPRGHRGHRESRLCAAAHLRAPG